MSNGVSIVTKAAFPRVLLLLLVVVVVVKVVVAAAAAAAACLPAWVLPRLFQADASPGYAASTVR